MFYECGPLLASRSDPSRDWLKVKNPEVVLVGRRDRDP
jgi:hypothetical protein